MKASKVLTHLGLVFGLVIFMQGFTNQAFAKIFQNSYVRF